MVDLNKEDGEKSVKNILLIILEFFGWLLIGSFVYSIFLYFDICPPPCRGENGMAIIYPLFAFFTVLPLGIVCVVFAKMIKKWKNIKEASE